MGRYICISPVIESSGASQVPGLGVFRLNPVRLVWRSIMVVIITVSHLAPQPSK